MHTRKYRSNTGTQHDKIGVVVVFMIGGGVTYAEARVVDTINRELNKHGDIRHVVLGGSNLLSSGDFIDLILIVLEAISISKVPKG